jgi:ubiquinone/menaquinone biosynthesis C-methylase UbiE
VGFEDVICSSCSKYSHCAECEKTEGNSLRRCQRTIEEQYYSQIRDKDVLEVGCGTKAKGGFVKAIVDPNNCRWVGIDIKETNLATHVCSVNKMPFEDNSFDWVIGSQTIEHWARPHKALREIHRLLRPGGMLSLTAPIHLHGEKMFVAGKFDLIEKLFPQNGFDVKLCQRWRKEHCDLVPYRPNDYAKKHLKKAGILDYDNITKYIIHCILKKNNNKIRKSFWRRITSRQC